MLLSKAKCQQCAIPDGDHAGNPTRVYGDKPGELVTQVLKIPFSNMRSHVKLNALHIDPALSHEGVFLCRKN
jgi:hypothetical protein